MKGVVTPLCACDARREAVVAQRLLYWVARRAWTLIGDGMPKRTMTAKARYYASTRGRVADHAGEPYTFVCCPFCGGDLPHTGLPGVVADATGDEGAEA